MPKEGLSGEETIQLRPGGRGPSSPYGSTSGFDDRSPPESDDAPLTLDTGEGPIVSRLRPLLALALGLQRHGEPENVNRLRDRVQARLKRFEEEAQRGGVDARDVRYARYAVGALIDDVVLNTPWGANSSWAAHSLVEDVNAGVHFFDLLEELRRLPAQNRELLQLMYLCLALGFQGQYRDREGGSEGRRKAQLASVRDDLLRELQRDGTPTELSPNWRGIARPHLPVNTGIPLWVVGVATLAILCAIYASFSSLLAAQTEVLGPVVGDLPPQGDVTIVRHYRPMAEAVPKPTQFIPRPDLLKPRVDRFLAQEIAAGLVETFEDANSLMVRLLPRQEPLFRSGKATLTKRYLRVAEKVAEALSAEKGRILVVGHSDSDPIRRNRRFRNNWELSEARASTVASLLTKYVDSDRVRFEGLGPTKPLVANTTSEGKARNRRIEIVLSKREAGVQL